MAHKRSSGVTTTTTTSGGDSLLERLPELILHEIFTMLELDTLCSLACVSRTLESSVNKTLASFSSIDLSVISSLDPQTFDGVISKFGLIKNITLDCLRLNDASIISILGPHIQELILLKCSSVSFKLLTTIGKLCPNLRILTLEFSGFNRKSKVFDLNFRGSFAKCQRLESLKIKIRGGEVDDYAFMLLGIYQQLPETVKIFKLQPASALDTILFLKTSTPLTFGQALTHISLVIDTISDTLIHNIAHCLPQLVELDLKDQSTFEPIDDLSNSGIQSLVNCKHLTSLSILRSRHHIAPLFKRVNDMGMFLLAEGCKRLESVRFGGFSKVSDAGLTSVLNSSLDLKRLEIQNGYRLTDLAFQDFSNGSRSLVEVKLVSCSSITSDAVCELATCGSLEVIDLLGCKSVSDSCLDDVSRLTLLATLNLGGTDVTDAGMGVLGKGNAPVSCLSLRGCKWISDEGIISLLISDGNISKTLTSLDLGHMPEITDKAITTIVDACAGLIELSVRNCVRVTDASVEALGLKGRVRRLDLYKCVALSGECFRFLKKPLFRGLQWIGIGGTRLVCVGDDGFDEVCGERRWLTICKDGCEVGCHDGWQFHEF
ncbi:F-box protein At-B-like [Bidens hawaiensis]|uniref:F-box protein At-B-like n=1 Tax=Bidens hawaiensis TaxID=980011 RepID=UPI00404B0FC9